jgi:hypothetical protein
MNVERLEFSTNGLKGHPSIPSITPHSPPTNRQSYRPHAGCRHPRCPAQGGAARKKVVARQVLLCPKGYPSGILRTASRSRVPVSGATAPIFYPQHQSPISIYQSKINNRKSSIFSSPCPSFVNLRVLRSEFFFPEARHGIWIRPMRLPSGSFTTAASFPPPTSRMACWTTAPSASKPCRLL